MSRALAVVPMLLSLALAVRAEEHQDTITVHGRGSVRVRPDVLTMSLAATGKAEKAADAVTKLKTKVDAIRAALDEIFKNSALTDVKVRDSGISFGAPADMTNQVIFGNGNQDTTAEVAVTTELTVSIGGVDKMKDQEIAETVSTILDKAVEAGAETKTAGNRYMAMIGQQGPSSVWFGFSDYSAQVEKAWDEATKKAKDRATAIAKRLGLGIGDAVRVRDISSGDNDAAKQNPYLAMFQGASEDSGPKIKSSGEVELSVDVEIEFRLTKK